MACIEVRIIFSLIGILRLFRSSQEEFILPGFDSVEPPAIVLKQIPERDSVIVGHNGAGGFCLW